MNKKRIVTLRVSGGLGNQLFQYAAARSVAIRCSADLVLDLSFYHGGRHRNFELNQFPIKAELRGLPKSKFLAAVSKMAGSLIPRIHYREKSFHYSLDFEQIDAPVSLDGYFQSFKYFDSCENQIRNELKPPALDGAYNRSLVEAISSKQSAILHVRRGDYVTNPKAKKTFAECTIDYYRRALEYLPANSRVFVFSDDILWAKQNLNLGESAVFIGDGTPRSGIEDLKLMSLGHHHIIANSTFSWWGAWLAGPNKGLTIAPARWFVDEAIIDSDLFPNDWVRC
jgi:hypothetical protein